MSITALPTPPSRQRPTTFSSEGDTFLAALPTFVTEANALSSEVNSNATQTLDDRGACELTAQTANFKGRWEDLTGALAIPASVLHSGSYWMLVSNLADVTLKEPGVDPEWELIFIDNSSTGGSKDWSIAVDTTLTTERWHNIAATVAELDVTLPSVGEYLQGGPLYVITNSGTNHFYIKKSNGDFAYTLLSFKAVEVYLSDYTTEAYSFVEIDYKSPTSLCPLSPELIFTSTDGSTYNSVVKLTDTTALLIYSVNSYTNAFKLRLLTLSNNSVSAGASVDLHANSNQSGVSAVALDSTRVLVFFNYYTTGIQAPRAVVVSVAGSVITVGSAVENTEGTTAAVYYFNSVLIDTDKVLLAYERSSNRYYSLVTVSGTTPTFNTYASHLTYTSTEFSKLIKVSTSLAISVHINANSVVYIGARTISISGTTLTANTEYYASVGGGTSITSIATHYKSGNLYVISVANTSPANIFLRSTLTVSGISITLNTSSSWYEYGAPIMLIAQLDSTTSIIAKKTASYDLGASKVYPIDFSLYDFSTSFPSKKAETASPSTLVLNSPKSEFMMLWNSTTAILLMPPSASPYSYYTQLVKIA